MAVNLRERNKATLNKIREVLIDDTIDRETQEKISAVIQILSKSDVSDVNLGYLGYETIVVFDINDYERLKQLVTEIGTIEVLNDFFKDEILIPGLGIPFPRVKNPDESIENYESYLFNHYRAFGCTEQFKFSEETGKRERLPHETVQWDSATKSFKPVNDPYYDEYLASDVDRLRAATEDHSHDTPTTATADSETSGVPTPTTPGRTTPDPATTTTETGPEETPPAHEDDDDDEPEEEETERHTRRRIRGRHRFSIKNVLRHITPNGIADGLINFDRTLADDKVGANFKKIIKTIIIIAVIIAIVIGAGYLLGGFGTALFGSIGKSIAAGYGGKILLEILTGLGIISGVAFLAHRSRVRNKRKTRDDDDDTEDGGQTPTTPEDPLSGLDPSSFHSLDDFRNAIQGIMRNIYDQITALETQEMNILAGRDISELNEEERNNITDIRNQKRGLRNQLLDLQDMILAFNVPETEATHAMGM